jgi:hypothetical protein
VESLFREFDIPLEMPPGCADEPNILTVRHHRS